MSSKIIKSIGLLILAGLLSTCFRPSQGKQIYLKACNPCHMEDGNGLVDLIPSFDPIPFETDRNSIVCTVVKGINDSLSGAFMPEFITLDDAQLANVLNYIRSLKAKGTTAFTDREVEDIRKDCRK